eukprot:328369-Amphidinium_carterae.1
MVIKTVPDVFSIVFVAKPSTQSTTPPNGHGATKKRKCAALEKDRLGSRGLAVAAEHIRRSFHSKTSNDRLTRSDSPGVTA